MKVIINIDDHNPQKYFLMWSVVHKNMSTLVVTRIFVCDLVIVPTVRYVLFGNINYRCRRFYKSKQKSILNFIHKIFLKKIFYTKIKLCITSRVWRYQRVNQNLYIESKGQKTQWPNWKWQTIINKDIIHTCNNKLKI